MTIKRASDITNKTVDDVISSLAPVNVDSSMDDITSPDEDKGPVFMLDNEAEKDVNPTMTSIDPKFAEGHGMTAATKIRARGKDNFEDSRDLGKETPKAKSQETVTVITTDHRGVRAATEVDIENIDESMIMNMPDLKAASFEILTMLNLKPKDKSMRFRWANFKNDVAGNLSKYYALGYQTASVEDVDLDKTPVHSSMVDGTQIKYYDILLIKIPVMRLMALYKANIIKSINRLDNARQRGLKEANRQFVDDITASGMSRQYNDAKAKLGGKEPVSFYTPGTEESEVVSA